MKRSNIVISSIALVIVGVVVTCLVAFKENPEWTASREKQFDPATEEKAIAEMAVFANRCTQVEELVLTSSRNLRGETMVSDSNRFRPLPQGEVKIDTLFENNGKKLTFRMEPLGTRNIYYYLQLTLPALKSISANNINIDAAFNKLTALNLQLKGETGCELITKTTPVLQVSLGDLSAIRYEPTKDLDNISITASGNALVKIPEATAKQLQQKGKLTLRDNAIVQ